MFISTCLWLLQCGANYGFVKIRGTFYHLFFFLGSYLLFSLGLYPLWMQFWMNFPSFLFCVSIYIAMFAMPIKILPFFGCGCHLLVSSLAGFFLAHVMLSFLGVQLNVESLLAYLDYAFHTMKEQLSSNMDEMSSKVLHCHSWLFHRDTQPDGLPTKL